MHNGCDRQPTCADALVTPDLGLGDISAARAQAASHRLDDDRSQLQEWGARLARLTREFDAAKEEVKSARTEIQTQRITLANQVCLGTRLLQFMIQLRDLCSL